MIGKQFGDWLVIDSAPSRIQYKYGRSFTKRLWLCQCVCGLERDVLEISLKNASSKSCGCVNKQPLRGTKVYGAWQSMLGRCKRPKTPFYEFYGGRGIKVCERWEDFCNFLGDMGYPPTPKHSLDRINNNGNYEPGNCRWATNKEQTRNTSRNVWIEFNDKRLCITDWATELGFSVETIRRRLKYGLSIEETFTRKRFVGRRPKRLGDYAA